MPRSGSVTRTLTDDLGEAVDLGEVADSEPPNHPLLVKVTDWLTQIVLGDEAARMLGEDEHMGLRADASGNRLQVGQVWLWREPKISVGRKARAKDGASYALPVRVTWDGGHLRFGPDGRSCAPNEWAAVGMGWDLSGTCGTTMFSGGDIPGPGFAWPATVPVATEVSGSAERALAELVDRGRSARWEFLLWLQPTVSSALVRAHSAIRAEMGDPRAGTLGPPLVDQVKLDQLRDQMLFGDDTHTSAAERLLTLCTAPGTFRRVDPLRYLTTAIRRDATTTLRRAIGDPHVGPKVRALSRELGTTRVATIVDEYRRRWPSDHLAAERAEQALSVGSDAMAHWVQVVER